MPPHNHDGIGGMHMYIPWWKFDRKNDFLRGYHTEIGGGRGMPGVGMFDHLCHDEEGYGASLKAKARKSYGTYIGFAGRGEMIPNRKLLLRNRSRCCGSMGHSRAALSLEWSDNEISMAKRHAGNIPFDRRDRAATYMTKTRPDGPHPYGIARWRRNHSRSGHRAHGHRPKTSALNQYCQAHDVKNVFVTDGACFVTNADKNPTLTIMALSWRASDYLLDQAKKGNL